MVLRTAYDGAFQEFSRQVVSLQSLLQHATPDRTAIVEARRRVEQAQSIYRDSRDSLAHFLLSHDMKGAPAGSLAVRTASQLRAELQAFAADREPNWKMAGVREDLQGTGRDVDHRSEVERLAHQLWEKAGRPVGRADEHWYRAEHLIQDTP